jgi:predicted nucleotidyltransferase
MDLLGSPILALFFHDQNAVLYPREIARRTKLHPNTVLARLQEYRKAGLLRLKPTRVLVEVTAERESAAFRHAKRVWNLYQVLSSGVVEFLYDAYNAPEAIILFGSFAKGEDTPKSDIDIAVITSKNLRPALGRFEKALRHPIQVTESKSPPEELLTSFANGIVLKGYLELWGSTATSKPEK